MSCPRQASIQWRVYEEQRTLHECLCLKLLESLQRSGTFALQVQQWVDQNLLVHFAARKKKKKKKNHFLSKLTGSNFKELTSSSGFNVI